MGYHIPSEKNVENNNHSSLPTSPHPPPSTRKYEKINEASNVFLV